MTRPKVGIVGNGNVGSAIEKGLSRAGYPVRVVGKDPPKVKELGQWADVIILAVPFGERENALQELGDTRGKVLVDPTNALTPQMEFALKDLNRSGAEELQEKARGANVVKAFNTVFAQNMAEGRVNGDRLSLFVAGDSVDAKKTVLELGRDLGFEPVDAGPLKNARWLETLGYFTIQLGYGLNMGPGIGFKLVRKT